MRDWGRWPKRLVEEANSTSGLYGLVSAGLAGAGVFFAAPVVVVAGGLLTATIAGISAYRAVPPKLIEASALVGDRITDLGRLEEVHPPIERIGFIGSSRVGKTTLISHLIAQSAPNNVRTEDPYATIAILQGKPPKYYALIDAAGQQFSQQFKIVDLSDRLVICLDHNASDLDPSVDDDRFRDQEVFLGHIEGHIKNSGKSLKAVHFILNKRDLWEDHADATRIRQWLTDKTALWRSLPNVKYSHSFHSNFRAADTTSLISKLREWIG